MPTRAPAAPLSMIRLALVAGVLLFGATIAILQRTVPPHAAAPNLDVIGYAQGAMAVMSVVVAMVLRGRVAAEPDAARRAGLLIIAWAVGESSGLFGGVVVFLGGAWMSYAI